MLMQYQIELLSQVRIRIKQIEERCVPEHEFDENVVLQLEQIYSLFLNNDNVISPENIKDLLKRVTRVVDYDVNSFAVSFLEANNEINTSTMCQNVHVGERFLWEAAQYKMLLEQVTNLSDFTELEFRKIKLQLTQPELGILIHLFTVCGFLAEKKKQKALAKNFSLIFSTIDGENLSPDNLEKAAATPNGTALGMLKEKFATEIPALRPRIIKKISKPQTKR